jgi:hypothetical protein
MSETIASYVKLNKLAAGGYTWNIQVSVTGGTLKELRRAKQRVLRLNEEFAHELLPEPAKPDEIAF